MEELQIDVYTFFGVVELAVVMLVAAVVLALRGKSLAARVRSLQSQLKKAGEAPPAVSFEQYLRDEALRNQAMRQEAAVSEEDDDRQAAQLLEIRQQFLELEIAARESENNPVRFRETLAAGFTQLVEQWRPEPEPVEVPAGDMQELAEAEDNAPEPAAPRATIDTHLQEFERLKQVILNQQDAMSALRAELKSREDDIQDLDSILRKLDEFEQHDSQLQQCLQVLEMENRRLKQAGAAGVVDDGVRHMDEAQLTGLKNMLNGQQQTIDNLQNLIQELAPEAGKAAELQSAIENIQRANKELNSCVAVLEDENAMLRTKLEAVNAQLQHQERQDMIGEPDLAVMDDDVGGDLDVPDADPSQDEEQYQLEVRVQELEALVEFKDAAIEELEKQYNALQAKYAALTADK